MTIKIKTRLHDGIYKSSGGGETHVHFEWKTGPRNLLRAIETLGEHSRVMTQGYGNIGHCGSWIEIDGVAIRPQDHNFDYDADPANFRDYSHIGPVSRTQQAADLIESVRDGSLLDDRERADAVMDEYYQ